MTREDWLQTAIEALREDFAEAGFPLPEVIHISTGLPTKRAFSSKERVVGQCFQGEDSEDKAPHIFISPTINLGLEVLRTMTHELCHAAVGTKDGHRGKFVECFKAIGMAGKATQNVAGPELDARLNGILESIGPYPHAKLDPKLLEKDKQTTRLLKVVCPNSHPSGDYIVRMTRKAIDANGTPFCPVHMVSMRETEKGGE